MIEAKEAEDRMRQGITFRAREATGVGLPAPQHFHRHLAGAERDLALMRIGRGHAVESEG